MTAPADTAQRIQAALEPFVRPREETAHIRRVLRAHLAASLKSDDSSSGVSVLDGSLALVNLPGDTAALPEARGLQKAYLRVLQANIEARRAFDHCAAASSSSLSVAPLDGHGHSHGHDHDYDYDYDNDNDNDNDHGLGAANSAGVGILQDHLATVKLRRKRDRLQVVNRYLDALGERPVAVAAGEDYLHPEFIYGDATLTLPSVPKAVMDGLAEDAAAAAAVAARTTPASNNREGTEATAASATDLEGLVSRLEKSVLRAQLVLRQEEKRLAAAKERSARKRAGRPPTAAAKLHALGAARDELIAWMEAELSNAGSEEAAEEDEEAAESSRQLRQSLLNGHDLAGNSSSSSSSGGALGDSQKTAQLRSRLDDIHDRYAEYVEIRRALVAAVGTMAVGGGENPDRMAALNPLFAKMPQLQPNSIGERAATTATQGGATTPSTEGGKAPMPTPAPSASTSTSTSTAEVEKAIARGHLLLAPYLERLLAVARNQKADITHKAHYSALLAKRLKDTCQMLDHLADESQLLPRFGTAKSGGSADAAAGAGGAATALFRKKGILAPAAGTAASPEGVTQRVIAWTEAADAAKIATFEAVFEKIEEGQVALEGAAEYLGEAELLLGKTPDGEPDTRLKKKGDIWSALNGELGLLRADDSR
ncbi:MAG: hypothetical protein STHCBS139747_001117 [Sporothrix thermara]